MASDQDYRTALEELSEVEEAMTRWSKSECQTFYEDALAALSEECEVVIATGRIVVDTRHVVGGGWMYEGHETSAGHFSLISEKKDGRATLHYDEESDALEGWWHESGISGMWRILLVRTGD